MVYTSIYHTKELRVFQSGDSSLMLINGCIYFPCTVQHILESKVKKTPYVASLSRTWYVLVHTSTYYHILTHKGHSHFFTWIRVHVLGIELRSTKHCNNFFQFFGCPSVKTYHDVKVHLCIYLYILVYTLQVQVYPSIYNNKQVYINIYLYSTACLYRRLNYVPHGCVATCSTKACNANLGWLHTSIY
jgi:hypothetical protein